MDKKAALDIIFREISHCKRCRQRSLGKPVPGEGSPKAQVVFIGEAPGREEAKTGRPFVGRSGKLLRLMIRTIGLPEQSVYLTSPVKYLPDRGTPTAADIVHGQTHLLKQLKIIAPKLVVLLGKTACYALFNKALPVLKEHGKVIAKDGRKYLVTVHPAAAVRFPKYKKLIVSDFQKLKSLI